MNYRYITSVIPEVQYIAKPCSDEIFFIVPFYYTMLNADGVFGCQHLYFEEINAG